TRAIVRKASDVHFDPARERLQIRFRLDGLLQEADHLPVSLAENVVARLKVLAGLLTYRKDIPQEGAFRADTSWLNGSGPVDVRVATFPTVQGERAVLRLMYGLGKVSDLDDLGLAPETVAELRAAAERPQGLILVTGPAGSGKSTTLYALARHILAATGGRSVVSIEDPVEQRICGINQIQVQPHGELTYVRAMRSLLRQDVEVLLVGEIRDAETAHIVTEAALTGHLIMSTLHSGDPAEALGRLLEMGIASYQVVSAVTLVVSQRLLRTACPDCQGHGSCAACMSTGFVGRTACGQIAVIDDTLRQAVLDHRPITELRAIIARDRPDLAADANRLVQQNITSADEVRRVLGSLVPRA
ncbi:MAG TPA: GspE/PulE family protein, partial [Phycisphaerae bacterium]|nr:GspE/PulE family protein [Phycisphaerae bacterium]